MDARRNFSRRGQNHRHFKKLTRFWLTLHIIDHFLRAEGANETFRVFCKTAAYDVIFFKLQGWGQVPSPAGAHDQAFLFSMFRACRFTMPKSLTERPSTRIDATAIHVKSDESHVIITRSFT